MPARFHLDRVTRADPRRGSLDGQSTAQQEAPVTTDDGMFLYIGTYPSEVAARDDYDIVKDLHSLDVVGTYDAAVITKDEKGKVHVNKDEMATRHGGWGGAAAGAVVGMLFPPALIGSALLGGAVGAASGHLWRGLSRSDVKELGELIDAGQAALLVVGASTLEKALDDAGLSAEESMAKQIDVSTADVDGAVKDAASQVS
jgi:uncharacterized membrane protein